MKAEILAVGTELLLGDILNTNAQYLSQQLASLGIGVYYQAVVGDNEKRLKDTIERAFEKSDLVITTGGLGPTEDNLTKETGAEYFNKKLVLNETALERMKKYFAKTNREMPDNNIKQAYVPEGCIVMQNNNGTAPGIIMEENGKILVMLPGPPREVIPMFEEQVKPFLAKKQEYTFVSRVLRVGELGESATEKAVIDLIDKQTNPTIATYAKPMEALIRLTAKAKDEKEAQKITEPVAKEIYSRIGEYIYGEGETDIQSVVAELLLKKHKTISTAESCTGGMLASNLIDYPGISAVFLEGAVTYSNEAKMKRLGVKKETLEKYGAVSHQTAQEMAEGIAKASGSDIALSTTGIAGPGGGSAQKPVGLIYVGLYINGKVSSKELRLVGNRLRNRELTVFKALNWLRSELVKE